MASDDLGTGLGGGGGGRTAAVSPLTVYARARALRIYKQSRNTPSRVAAQTAVRLRAEPERQSA